MIRALFHILWTVSLCAIPILYVILLSFHFISFLDFFVCAIVCRRQTKRTHLNSFALSIWLKMPLAIQFN